MKTDLERSIVAGHKVSRQWAYGLLLGAWTTDDDKDISVLSESFIEEICSLADRELRTDWQVELFGLMAVVLGTADELCAARSRS